MLFAIGSACFLVGPFPGFVQLVGSEADGVVFFVGSIFFTSAALLQYLEAANTGDEGKAHRRLRLLTFEPRRIDWWITGSQLLGTVFFNVNTYRALQSAIDDSAVDRLILAPRRDRVGAVPTTSGVLAFYEVRAGGLRIGQRSRDWRIATVNLLGCILFAVSAVASLRGSRHRQHRRPRCSERVDRAGGSLFPDRLTVAAARSRGRVTR